MTARADDRAATEVGRNARLELAFEVRNGRTVLAHGYAEPPLRIGRTFEEGRGVHLILASSSPGVFDRDRMQHVVRLGAGAVVRLTSQSAMQLHASPPGGPAVLSSHYEIAPGAALTCEWHPSIPFANASIDEQIDIDVAAGGRLSWSDAMMCGREGSGERWRFNTLARQLRLRRNGALAYLERYRVEPGARPVSTAMGCRRCRVPRYDAACRDERRCRRGAACSRADQCDCRRQRRGRPARRRSAAGQDSGGRGCAVSPRASRGGGSTCCGRVVRRTQKR